MLPTGVRVQQFTSEDKANKWLGEMQSQVSVIDIKITYAPPFNWNREEYGWGNVVYVVLYVQRVGEEDSS